MSEDQRRTGRPSASVPYSRARPPLRVLLVDADHARADELRRLLPRDSVVAIASSVQAALGLIAQQVPDLIITDLDLPGVSGLQLIFWVHHNPATRHTLLMVVTSRATLNEKIAALQAGADDFLVRPVNPERFASHVQLVSHFRRTFPR